MARKVTAGHEALRASEHNTSVEPDPYEVAAIDANGDELYRTESFGSRKAAQRNCDEFDDGSAYWVDNISDEVDHFEPRKR